MTFAVLRGFGLAVIAFSSNAAQAAEPPIRYTAPQGCPMLARGDHESVKLHPRAAGINGTTRFHC